MKYLNLEEMKERISQMVQRCSKKHDGGESYFDYLDGLIKSDPKLLASYIKYIADKERTNHIVMSGGIGRTVLELQTILCDYIPSDIEIICVDGGLRSGGDIQNVHCTDFSLAYIGSKYIFVDDTYYSGKTTDKVKEFVSRYFGKDIVKTYVFYDGSLNKNEDVKSLYRYYE